MQAQITIHISPPGSLCSPPLPGSRDPGTTSLGEHMVCLRLLQCQASLCHHRLTPHSITLPSTARVSQSPLISCYFNPILSGRGTDALRQPTCRGGAKSKAEPQELSEQRREREVSPSSLRSSGLNLHNQLDMPCICGIPEKTTNHPKIEAVDFGSNCRLGVYFLHLICFWFYIYLSLAFRAYYHW